MVSWPSHLSTKYRQQQQQYHREVLVSMELSLKIINPKEQPTGVKVLK